MSTTTQLQRAAQGERADADTSSRIEFLKSLNGELDLAIPPAIKKTLTPDRMCRLAITAMRQVRNLNKCTFESIAGALMVSAQLGLECNTPLQQAFMIPRWNGERKCFEATFQLGYQGMLELAYRTELVLSVTAKAVYSNDVFIYEEGLEDRLIHRPKIDGDRGHVIAYYAVMKFVTGGHAFDVMSHMDMVRHMERFAPRDRSGDRIVGPWATDFDGMALKTMIRRLFKFMRKSTDIVAKATLYDDRVVDREMRTNELLPQFDEPRAKAPLPPPVAGDDGMDEEEPDPEPEPRPAAKTPRKRQAAAKMEVISEKVGPSIEAPFDDAPAHDDRQRAQPSPKAEQAAHPLAASIKAMEAYLVDAAAKHEADGLPDLADRNELLNRIWEKLAATGDFKPETVHYYSRLNEVGKFFGDADASVRSLAEANKAVTADYMGAPLDEDPSPAPAAEEKPAAKPAANPAAKMAEIEKAFEDFAAHFGRQGVQAMVMPSAVVAEVYSRAAKAGLVKGDASGYRTRLHDFAEMPGTAHDVVQRLKDFCKAILAEMKPNTDREPGADG